MKTRSLTREIAKRNVKKTRHPKLIGKGRVKKIYDMSAKIRGYCIIIANAFFPKNKLLEPLPGYIKDAHLLGKIFGQLNFRSKIFENQNAGQILAILKKYANKCADRTENAIPDGTENAIPDAFVFILLTHGNEDELFSSGFISRSKTPEEILTEKKILQVISNENCRLLIGKPKMSFIQACRGEKEDKGVAVAESNASSVPAYLDEDSQAEDDYGPAVSACGINSPTRRSAAGAQILKVKHNDTVPSRTDTMVCYSTIPGYRSYVKPEGSTFGRLLAQVLIDDAHNTDLQHIINILSDKMQKTAIDCENNQKNKQSVCVNNYGWTGKLYFNPGYPKALKVSTNLKVIEQSIPTAIEDMETDCLQTMTNKVPPCKNTLDIMHGATSDHLANNCTKRQRTTTKLIQPGNLSAENEGHLAKKRRTQLTKNERSITKKGRSHLLENSPTGTKNLAVGRSSNISLTTVRNGAVGDPTIISQNSKGPTANQAKKNPRLNPKNNKIERELVNAANKPGQMKLDAFFTPSPDKLDLHWIGFAKPPVKKLQPHNLSTRL